MKAFNYIEPKTIKEALQALLIYGSRAIVLAGGVDLVVKLKKEETAPEVIISIREIPHLDYIKNNGKNYLHIGTMTSLESIERSKKIQKNYSALYEAVQQISSIQVKNMATAVGNICAASPASDIAPALMVLGSELKIVGIDFEKMLPIESFFLGVNQTILRHGELVTEILLPSIPTQTGSAFLKLSRTAGDVSKVNVAALITMGKDDICTNARIALGSIAPTPIRAKKTERILIGQRVRPKVIAEAAEAALEESKPITDIRSTAEYRSRMVKVLVRRVIGITLDRINKHN